MTRHLLARSGALLLALAAFAPTTADAGQWAFTAGFFDIARDEKPVELGIEYRFKPLLPSGLFEKWGVDLVPTVGVAATEEGNAWAVTSMRFEWQLSQHWQLTPLIGVAVYRRGAGKGLGGPIEFKTGLELAHRFANGQRFGLIFYHLSNAIIYDFNAGANTLALTWSLGPRGKSR